MTNRNTDFLTKLLEKQDKLNKIAKNYEYINWLTSFTSKYLEFTDDDFLYSPELISKEDNINIYDLGIFFEAIDNFARSNYIYPYSSEFGGYYNIKYNNIGFEIGSLVGQGTLFFCKRVNVNNDEYFIDFDDIVNNKKLEHTSEVTSDLNKFKDYIKSLCDKGIPLEAIRDTFDSTYSEIKNNVNQLILK